MVARLRNPLGSWLLGSGTEMGRRLRLRVQLLLAILVTSANIVGSVLTATLLLLSIHLDKPLELFGVVGREYIEPIHLKILGKPLTSIVVIVDDDAPR